MITEALGQSARNVDTTQTQEEISPKELQNKKCKDIFARLIAAKENRQLSEILGSHFQLVEHVLLYESPVTDPNIRRERGSTKPLPTEFGSLESTSWNLRPSPLIQELWNTLTDEVIALLENQNFDDPNFSVDAQLTELKKKHFEKADPYIDAFLEILKSKGITPRHVYISGSGAHGIVLATKLLGKDKKIAATTRENGSLVYEGFKEGGLIAIDVRDPRTNEPYDDDTMLAAYKKAMDEGAEVLSVTMSSKTDIALPNSTSENSLINLILAEVGKRNAIPGSVQIRVVLDVVQQGGRKNFDEILGYLNNEHVDAISFSGSKAPGGSPHIGFTITSESGQAHVDATLATQPDAANTWIANNQVVRSETLEGMGYNTKQNLTTAFRGADNARAWLELLSLPAEKQLYSERAKQLSKVLHDFFSFMGCNILRRSANEENEDYSSIVSFEPPLGISPVYVKELFLKNLEQKGFFLGGFLHENGAIPILRAGVSIDWLKRDITVEQLRQAFFGDASVLKDLEIAAIIAERDALPNVDQTLVDPAEENAIQRAREQKKIIKAHIAVENKLWEILKTKNLGMISIFAEAVLEARGAE